MIGDVVLYTFSTHDVTRVVQELGTLTKVPPAGQQFSAVVTVDHGGGVVNLRVLLDGPEVLVKRNVAEGAAGTPGVWAPRV